MGMFYPAVRVATALAEYEGNFANSETTGPPLGRHVGQRATSPKRSNTISRCLQSFDMYSGDFSLGPACTLSTSPLQLPLAPRCGQLSDVMFNQPFNPHNKRCPFHLTKSTCQSAQTLAVIPGQGVYSGVKDVTRIHALSYLTGDAANARSCPPYYRIYKGGLSSDATISTSTNYYCLNNSEIFKLNYIKSTSQTKPTAADSQTNLFTKSCKDNTTNASSLRTAKFSSPSRFQPTLCDWDTGEVYPPAPRLSGNVCENIVLSVDYHIIIASNSISNVVVNLHIGNVDVSDPVQIHQSFTALFVTSTSNPTTIGDNLRRRSGVKGYKSAASLITGKYQSSTDGSNFLVSIVSAEGVNIGIGYPIAGSDGLCENAILKTPLFLQDVQSRCMIKLGLECFSDCQNLRRLILLSVNQYFSFDFVAAIGDPSTTNASNWITVQKSPNDFVRNQAGDTLYQSHISSQCDRIPSGIHLNLFYSTVGNVDGVPIRQLIGAHINYTLSLWTFYCKTEDEISRCMPQNATANSVNLYMPFALSVQVSYFEVPANWRAAIREPNLDNEEENCEWSSCWKQAFSPWTELNLVTETDASLLRARCLAVGIIFGAIGCFAILLAKPM